MAVLLLDTTVIVDTINGKKDRGQLLDGLLARRNLLACRSINITEVYAGMRPHETTLTEGFLRSLKFYGVTWEIARLAGELQRQWRKKGRTIALTRCHRRCRRTRLRSDSPDGQPEGFPMPELTFYPLQ
ncbi:MAG: hypothetical protein ABI165_03855 [Bryobacteraceae bacterium]